MPKGQGYFFQQNRLGSVTHLTGFAGELIEKYRYDAFGAPTTVEPVLGYFNNRFRFTGREYLEAFGIYEYRNRAYHPGLGRFLSEDPMGFDAGDTNMFRYCDGDPVNRDDPSGLQFTLTPSDDMIAEYKAQYYGDNLSPHDYVAMTYNNYVVAPYNSAISLLDPTDIKLTLGLVQGGVGVYQMWEGWKAKDAQSFSEGAQTVSEGIDEMKGAMAGQGVDFHPAPLKPMDFDQNFNFNWISITGFGPPTPNDWSIGVPIPGNGNWIYGGNNAPAGSIIARIDGHDYLSPGPIFSNGGFGSAYDGPSVSGYAQGTYNGYGGGDYLQQQAALRNGQ